MTAEEGSQMEEVTTEPVGFASIRDQIRAEREAIASEKTLDLLVPGYSGLLAVRYRSISDREMEGYAKRLQKDGDVGIRAGYDLLIEACEAILVRMDTSDEFEVLEDDNGDAVKFDVRLAEFLDVEAASARETVAATFSPEGVQSLAAVDQAGAVLAWLQGKSSEIDPSLLGN